MWQSRYSTLWATNGTGFTPGPPPGNRQPMGLVKVLLYRTTTSPHGQGPKGKAPTGARRLRRSASSHLPPVNGRVFAQCSIKADTQLPPTLSYTAIVGG